MQPKQYNVVASGIQNRYMALKSALGDLIR